MSSVKDFVRRNAPVFFLGAIIVLIFLIVIFASSKGRNITPAGFRKVEEEIFEDRESTQPAEEKQGEYAPQIPNPGNVGKPYFYGEYNPNLRDEKGYPMAPAIGSTVIPDYADEQDKVETQALEYEEAQKRKQVVAIDFTTDGFKPQLAQAYTGGTIVWTNRTATEIKLVQTLPIHLALKGGTVLAPGESFEFRPLVNKQFVYLDDYTKKSGSISIIDVTKPLVDRMDTQ